jgi:hypothetical protein
MEFLLGDLSDKIASMGELLYTFFHFCLFSKPYEKIGVFKVKLDCPEKTSYQHCLCKSAFKCDSFSFQAEFGFGV